MLLLIKVEKEKQIHEIEEKIDLAKVVIFSNFCGLKVNEMEELRKMFRQAKVEYKVFKNTLIQRAMEEHKDITEFLKEPTGLVFGYDDPSIPAKIVTNFAKDKPAFKIKGGVIEGRVFNSEAIKILAALPPREFLLAKAVMSIRAPLVNLVNVMNAPAVKLINTLRSLEEKKKKSDQ